MKKAILVGLTTGLLTAVPAVASAEGLSATCESLNGSFYDSEGTAGYLIFGGFNAGEVLTVRAEQIPLGDATGIELWVDFALETSVSAPGETSWEITWTVELEDVDATVFWLPVPGTSAVAWDISCGLDGPEPPADADGDGVLDEDDACADTTIGDAPEEFRKNRFYVNGDGEFVDGEGNLFGASIADTHGCDDDQIIEALGLGQGHERYGITRGALEDYLASL